MYYAQEERYFLHCKAAAATIGGSEIWLKSTWATWSNSTKASYTVRCWAPLQLDFKLMLKHL